jgi:hypothetical protein
MNNVSARNWTDKQWFAFICGLVKMGDLSTPTPGIPDIVGNFQCIFPPGTRIDTATNLEDYQLIVRVSSTVETRHDYLLDLRDLSLQETNIVAHLDTLGDASYGIVGRIGSNPYLLKTNRIVYIASLNSMDEWSYNTYKSYSSLSANDIFIGMALINTSVTQNQGIVALYEDANYDQHMRLDYKYKSEYFKNIKTDNFYVDGVNYPIKTVSAVNDNLVIWINKSGSLKGYVVTNLKLHFSDDLIRSSSIYDAAWSLEVTAAGEEFEIPSIQSQTIYDTANVYVYTDNYNNTKVAVVGVPSLRTDIANTIRFASAALSHDTIEFVRDTDTLNVVDGIDPNTIFYNNNTQVTVPANTILLYILECSETQYTYNWYAFNFETGDITQVSNMGSVTSGFWDVTDNYSTTSECVVDSANAEQYIVARPYRQSLNSRLEVNRLNTSGSFIQQEMLVSADVDLTVVQPYCVSLALVPHYYKLSGQGYEYAGDYAVTGIRDETYEIYDRSSYYVYGGDSLSIHVTYNNVRYCVYKITQSYDKTVVLWIATSAGTVGLEFESFKVIINGYFGSALEFEGTFTGYVYEIPDQTFIVNIKTFRNNNHRVALWSRSYYDTSLGYNKTATHISYPTYTADTAVITS